MFLSSSLFPLFLWPPPLPSPYLPLHSLLSLLRRDLDTDPDLDPDLDLVIDAPEAEVPLDLFLLLLRGDLDLNLDLVLASQVDPPTPLPSLLSNPSLSPPPLPLLLL